MTFEKAQKLHRELWNWLAETGEDSKSSWDGWMKVRNYSEPVRFFSCFACAFGRKGKVGRNASVECNCPIVWTDSALYIQNFACEDNVDSLYRKWRECPDVEQRKHFAALIRDLPWTYREIYEKKGHTKNVSRTSKKMA